MRTRREREPLLTTHEPLIELAGVEKAYRMRKVDYRGTRRKRRMPRFVLLRPSV